MPKVPKISLQYQKDMMNDFSACGYQFKEKKIDNFWVGVIQKWARPLILQGC